MKLALAQINPTIGDFPGNWNLIEEAIHRAQGRGAELCVFPEMSITGSPPRDLLLQDRFVRDNLELLDRLVQSVADIGVIIGYVRPSSRAGGVRLENAAAIINDGEIVSTHVKTRLTADDGYDEHRYFDSGDAMEVLNFRGTRLGVTIAGEIFQTGAGRGRRPGDRDPVADAVSLGAEIIINIGAVPYTMERRARRERLLVECARSHRRPVIFVNQVGGNDEYVYDGNSLALDAAGRITARTRGFEPDVVVVDVENSPGLPLVGSFDDIEDIIAALTLGTRDFTRKCGYATLLLELSYSLDAAVAAAIAARAVGPGNVYGLIMPRTPEAHLDKVEAIARALGIRYDVQPIDGFFNAFCAPHFGEAAETSPVDSAAACIRHMFLVNTARRHGHLVVDTHCRSDIAVGYRAHYCGEMTILADVPRTLVRRIASRLGQQGVGGLEALSDSAVESELLLDSGDPASRTPYETLDALIELIEEHGMDPQIIGSLGFEEALVHRVIQLVKSNGLARRKAPPGFRVVSASFGTRHHLPFSHNWSA